MPAVIHLDINRRLRFDAALTILAATAIITDLRQMDALSDRYQAVETIKT